MQVSQVSILLGLALAIGRAQSIDGNLCSAMPVTMSGSPTSKTPSPEKKSPEYDAKSRQFGGGTWTADPSERRTADVRRCFGLRQ